MSPGRQTAAELLVGTQGHARVQVVRGPCHQPGPSVHAGPQVCLPRRSLACLQMHQPWQVGDHLWFPSDAHASATLRLVSQVAVLQEWSLCPHAQQLHQPSGPEPGMHLGPGDLSNARLVAGIQNHRPVQRLRNQYAPPPSHPQREQGGQRAFVSPPLRRSQHTSLEARPAGGRQMFPLGEPQICPAANLCTCE